MALKQSNIIRNLISSLLVSGALTLAACGGGSNSNTDAAGAASSTPAAIAVASDSVSSASAVTASSSPTNPATTSTPAASNPSTPATSTTKPTTGSTSTPVVSNPVTTTPAASTPTTVAPAAGELLDTSFGVKGDNATNDTKALQKAIDGSVGQTLVITGKSRIDTTGLTLRDNSHLRFATGASLKLLAHNTNSYQILRIWDVSNVVVEGATIDGSKELNSASGGEWGMGISIAGSTNVTLTNPTTSNCWGDGIYISNSQTSNGKISSNITVNNHIADGNRRQGVSIISGSGITFNSPTWKNTKGTPPAAGLDIEPDSNDDVLQGIKINSPSTSGNAGAGIQVYLGALPGPVAKKIDITISNHTDTNTGSGPFGVGGLGGMGSYSVTGTIVTTNPVWTENWYKGDWSNAGPTISVVNPTINK